MSKYAHSLAELEAILNGEPEKIVAPIDLINFKSMTENARKQAMEKFPGSRKYEVWVEYNRILNIELAKYTAVLKVKGWL